MNELVDSTKGLAIATQAHDSVLKACSRAILVKHGGILLDSDPQTVVEAYLG